MKINIHILPHLAQLFLKREVFQTKFVEKIKETHFRFNIFFLTCAVCEIMWVIQYSLRDQGWQYGACEFHTGYQRLQTHTQNM